LALPFGGDKLVAVKEGRLQQGGGDSHQSVEDFFLRHAFLFFKKFF
jgi:hypothetical protein